MNLNYCNKLLSGIHDWLQRRIPSQELQGPMVSRVYSGQIMDQGCLHIRNWPRHQVR